MLALKSSHAALFRESLWLVRARRAAINRALPVVRQKPRRRRHLAGADIEIFSRRGSGAHEIASSTCHHCLSAFCALASRRLANARWRIGEHAGGRGGGSSVSAYNGENQEKGNLNRASSALVFSPKSSTTMNHVKSMKKGEIAISGRRGKYPDVNR